MIDMNGIDFDGRQVAVLHTGGGVNPNPVLMQWDADCLAVVVDGEHLMAYELYR